MVRRKSRSDLKEESRKNKQKGTTIAQVTQTIEAPSSPGDKSNVIANVIYRNSEKELRGIPVSITNHRGHTIVPQKNDWVRVEYRGPTGEFPEITAFVYTPEQLPALARPGHWRHEFRQDSSSNLYIEAEPSDHSAGNPDVVRMGVKEDGLSDPTTEVAVDDSGESTKVQIKTDGDIHLSADGDILIDQGGTAEPVAKQNHDHDHTRADGSTGTTETPNQDGTKTKIE